MKVNRCYGCMEEITAFPCPHCGYQPGEAPGYALAPGTILNGKYLVGKLLGQGGFGLTYIGWDLMLEQKVAIKEYYPSGQVVRQNGATLQWYGTQQAQTARDSGKDIFLKEARKMTRVRKIPQVVQVLDLFLANETAYIVMDFIEGETLKQRLQKTGPLSWQDARDIFLPVIQAMEQVHRAGLIHRDLSPDNLMLQPDGGVRILDLGAAKDLNLNSGVSSMQVAKSGFSPLEQYIQQGGSGTWTDVYSIAATIYYTLTGILPPSAVDRITRDTLRWDLPQLKALPSGVLHALQKAMAIRSEDRTQTMQELYQGISVSKTAPKPPKAAAPGKKAAGKQPVSAKTEPVKPKKGGKLLLPLGVVLACAVIGVGILLWKPAPKAEEPVIRQETTPPTEVTIPSPEELQYNQAASWEADGQLGRAAIAFGQLGDYRDANARSFAIWEKITPHEMLLPDGRLTATVAAIKSGGTVAAASIYPELEQAICGWTDIVSLIAARRWTGEGFCITVGGLKSDGTVVTVSSMPDFGFPDVDGWTQVVAIRSEDNRIVGLRSDGTVVATGDNTYGQCDVEDWNGVIAIEMSGYCTVGLRYDGTVLAAGRLSSNEPDIQPYVSDWTDIAAVDVELRSIIGLKTDGTVVYRGPDDEDWEQAMLKVSGWTDIVDIHLDSNLGSGKILGLTSDGTVVGAASLGWEGMENAYGRLNVSEWTDIAAVSGDVLYSVGLKSDGTVVTAGLNRNGRCHVTDWTDIAAVWADYDFTLGLKSDGTFVLAGQSFDGWNPIRELLQWENIRIPTKPLPARNGKETKPEGEEPSDPQAQYDAAEELLAAGETAKAAIAFGKLGNYMDARQRSFALWEEVAPHQTFSAGHGTIAAIKADGTVTVAVSAVAPQKEAEDWTNVVSLSIGMNDIIGLKVDGTVVAKGMGNAGQLNVDTWHDIVAISAGIDVTAGLKSDGTVIIAGNGSFDTSEWENIIAISAGTHVVGLKEDGTVVATGDNTYGKCAVSSWTDIVAINAAGGTIGLKSDGTVVTTGFSADSKWDISDWTDIVDIDQGTEYIVGLQSDGTLRMVGSPYNKNWIVDISDWTDIIAISADTYVVGLKADGTVRVTGGYAGDQIPASDWTDIKLPVLSTHPSLPACVTMPQLP